MTDRMVNLYVEDNEGEPVLEIHNVYAERIWVAQMDAWRRLIRGRLDLDPDSLWWFVV